MKTYKNKIGLDFKFEPIFEKDFLDVYNIHLYTLVKCIYGTELFIKVERQDMSIIVLFTTNDDRDGIITVGL